MAAKTRAASSCGLASKNSPACDLEGNFPLVGGTELEKLLGYKNSAAFRQALHRKTLPVPVFSIENRRGKFAFRTDIARWLDDLRSRVAAGDA